jgi:hypothetical protein
MAGSPFTCNRSPAQGEPSDSEPSHAKYVIGDIDEVKLARSVEGRMSLGTILLIILVILVIGAIPAWPYSTGWNYYPSGVLGIVLIVVLVLVLMGHI